METQVDNLNNQTQDGNLTSQTQQGSNLNSEPETVSKDMHQQGALQTELQKNNEPVQNPVVNAEVPRRSFNEQVDLKAQEKMGREYEELLKLRKENEEIKLSTMSEKEKTAYLINQQNSQIESLTNELATEREYATKSKIVAMIGSHYQDPAGGSQMLYSDITTKAVLDNLKIISTNEGDVLVTKDGINAKDFLDKFKNDHAGMFRTIKMEGNGSPKVVAIGNNASIADTRMSIIEEKLKQSRKVS